VHRERERERERERGKRREESRVVCANSKPGKKTYREKNNKHFTG